MRHVILLGLASLLFAVLTWFAYTSDSARQQSILQDEQAAIDADLYKLEQGYLAAAHTLITALDATDPLIADLDALRIRNPAETALPRAERATRFDALVDRIRARLLSANVAAMSDPVAQEWRRATDQMNGALHRRKLLLETPAGH